MGSLEVYLRRGLCLLAVAAVVSACSGGDTHRTVVAETDGGDAGDAGKAKSDAGPRRDAGGPFQYTGSTGSSGGTVMQGGGYILFGVTGEVPGTSGLTKNANHRMVGGVVGRASY